MAQHEWLPKIWEDWGESRTSPFHALRKQVDTLFEDFDKGFPTRVGPIALRTNVSETDKDICITAELPGIKLEDVDVEVSGDRISIKGEKSSEEEEKGEKGGRTFHRIERSSGAFQRVTRLPFEIDPGKIDAKMKDGVLTVTIPKPAEEQAKTQKVKIKNG